MFLFRASHGNSVARAGIPAHVVTGYLGGEWNEFGGYWMVKNNMAHAWVEAYFPDEGWRRFDPTVSVSPGSMVLSWYQVKGWKKRL